MMDVPKTFKDTHPTPHFDWLWDFVLIVILLGGAYFRFTGLDWDQNQHLHPDERFLTMVETAIEPVHSISQYFDTKLSTLNPNNRGYGFYVYGTLPLFAVRYAAEWLGETGYDQVQLVGRQLSAVMDLGTVLVVYLIAMRLYRRRRLALLAAAFASLSVLPIQLSHYFTVDTFTNFFGMLAFYFAICLLPIGKGWEKAQVAAEDHAALEDHREGTESLSLSSITREWRSVILYILFGAALGLAMASKINALFLAVLLPGAVLLRYLSQPLRERERWF
ncbi:MAG: phospholipid carrier-dependent glycosyltransferase, partial [Anaerolineaceae bacterium]|nr:phospholipid carrier-dependent glycosyltransferase [Anaerolineaceae bacterium]